MISRASTQKIADAYHQKFTGHRRGSHGNSVFELYSDSLYDFLYVNNFDAWFLNAVKRLASGRRELIEFILRLHTGESVAAATVKWTSKQRQALGQRLLGDLARSIIAARLTDHQFDVYSNRNREAVDAMRAQLELDGYIYRDGVLLVPEETVLDEQEEQGVLERLFINAGLAQRDVFEHHLRLSVEHYQNERWDDCIANSRKVLELVLSQVADRLGAAKGNPMRQGDLERPAKVREYLESVGLLEQKEREAVAKIYALLSDTGGHPYIAHRDQARLLRHYALTTTQFVLLRLTGILA